MKSFSKCHILFGHKRSSRIAIYSFDVLNIPDILRKKYFCDWNKQIAITRSLVQNISETAHLVGCSGSFMVSTFRQWSDKKKKFVDKSAAKAYRFVKWMETFPRTMSLKKSKLWRRFQIVLMKVKERCMTIHSTTILLWDCVAFTNV